MPEPTQLLLRLLASALLATPHLATTQAFDELRVDFGGSNLLSAGGSPAWNDVQFSNVGLVHDLVDVGGAATAVTLTFDPGAGPEGQNEAGVTSPTPGSPMALLSWPTNALRDTFYGSDGRPEMAFVLANLDTARSYDFTFVASRMGVSDDRTTRYSASGFNTASVELDPANNTSSVANLAGVVPNAQGEIRVRVRAAASNTNSSGYYYLNALGIEEDAAGSSGPLLALSNAGLSVARRSGSAPFVTQLSAQTLSGATPAVTLNAVDDATGLPPTWLSLPANVVAGTPFSLTFDASGEPVGQASATLTARSNGYPDAQASVGLRVTGGDVLHLLYYGNSYSQGNGGMPNLVRDLAEAAGFPAPVTVSRLVGGQNLAFHLNDPVQAAAITQALPLGATWDFVVLQGFSTEATVALGNPGAFRANALAILSNVRDHSPAARACLFQTWARAPGSSVYPTSFPNPVAMHRQIEASYTQAAVDMDQAFGPDTARRAAAGEAAFLTGFDASLYTPDFSHPEPPMSLMTALAVLKQLYGTDACDIEPDFGGPSNLAQRLAGFGIGPVAWRRWAGLADRVARPAQRRFAGSSDDYLLTSGTTEALDACTEKEVAAGAQLTLTLLSPNGSMNGASSMLWLDLNPAAPGWPGDPLLPELHVSSSTSMVLMSSASLPAEGHTVSWDVPSAMGGRYVLIQGHVLSPSFVTGRAFTTTDAHRVRLLGAPRRSAPGGSFRGPR